MGNLENLGAHLFKNRIKSEVFEKAIHNSL